MKKLLKLLLVLLLTLGLVGFKSSDELELKSEALSKEVVDQLKQNKKLPKVDDEGRPLFLSKEQVLQSADATELLRVVIELEGEPVVVTATKLNKSVEELNPAQVKAQQKVLKEQQKQVKKALQKAGIKLSNYGQAKKAVAADQSFTVSFNGFSTYVSAKDIAKLEKVSGVKAVYIANEYLRPAVSKQQYTSVNQVMAPLAWGLYGYDGTGQVVAVVDSGIDPGHPDFALSDVSKATLTKAKVEQLGLPGKFYTDKVPYAYNYYDLSQQVLDIGSGGQHGQHVAGSVAANGKVKGVAPEAQLLGMKVFSDDVLYATTFSDIYLKAIDDAVALGADALNLSLGSPAGFYVVGSAEDVAINHALENGILSTISAGNEHNAMNGVANFANFYAQRYGFANHKNPDLGVTGSPSVNAGSLSVASVDNTNLVAHRLDYQINGESKIAQMTPAQGAPDGSKVLPGLQPVVKVGIGRAEDFAEVGDAVKGKVALVMRGNLFTDSIVNAMNAGASALIVYNHAAGGEGHINMAGGDLAKIPFVFIGHAAGNTMSEALANGQEVKVAFSSEMLAVENPTANEISDFSSWGSTPGLQMKPEITAPGGLIYSTQNGSGYTTMSGTSMAAPHAAGGAAVVAQRLKEDVAFAHLTPSQRASLVKVLLMNTATPLVDPGFGGHYVPYSVRAQGAGLMNVAKAVDTSVYVVEANSKQPKVELGSIDRTNFSVRLTLTNVSDVAQSFAVDSLLLRDYYQNVAGINYNVEAVLPMAHNLDAPKSVVVPARGSTTISLSFDFSQAVGNDPARSLVRNQFVDGYIYLESADPNQVDLVVPVLGFYGDWDEPKVLDELRWNLLDADPSNDPTFVLTTPVYRTEEGDLYFVNPEPTIWMSPKSGDVGDTIGFLGTVLRNAEEINFRVRDVNGKVVRELGESTMQRKIYRMAQGAAPYRYFSPSTWDGTLNGQVPASGSQYLYEVEVLRTKFSPAQTMQFAVTIDTLGPEISQVYYDPGNKVLSFALADAGIGEEKALVALRKQPSQNVAAVLGEDGLWHADVSTLVAQESNAQLLIVAFDELGNASSVRVKVKSDKAKPEPSEPETPVVVEPEPETAVEPSERPNDPFGEVQIVLTAPDLLAAYDTSHVKFSGWVYGVPEVSSLKFGDHELTLTKVEKASVTDTSGNELYYGLAYRFDQEIELGDGYYEVPLVVTLTDDSTFQIVRRFWVDTTAPTLSAKAEKVSKGATNTTVELEFADNLAIVELYRDDNYLTVVDMTNQAFGYTNVTGSYSDTVELQSKPSKVVYKAVDIAGNVHKVTVNLPKR